MSFLKNIFGKKEEQIKTNADFWRWFAENEKTFFNVVNNPTNIERDFFDHLSLKLNQLKPGYFFLAGMCDNTTAELVITVDGIIKNIVFAEELVAGAPEIKGWKFTALKPSMDIGEHSIQMGSLKFGSDNMHFYSNGLPRYPDEIDITIVHDDFNEKDKNTIINGSYIFLDNYLGELEFATTIDNVSFVAKSEDKKQLVPIIKLKDFLHWRQKEFIEKYEGTWHSIENDAHSIMETQLDNGRALVAVINTDLLQWDSKASHPWILTVEIKYDGDQNNGMPDKTVQEFSIEIEDKLYARLKDVDGYLNIGRETGNNTKEIHFACRDFRLPAKVSQSICDEYVGKVEIDYDIYKDKYWKSFNRFASW